MNGIGGRSPGIESATVGMLPALLLGGCLVGAGVEETILPARIDYECSKGRVLQVARSQDALHAAVVDEGKKVVLRRMDSAAQEKYGDGRYSLYLDGERAMLELDSQVLYGPCLSPVPLPSAPRYR